MLTNGKESFNQTLLNNRIIILQFDTKVKGRYNISNNIPSKNRSLK